MAQARVDETVAREAAAAREEAAFEEAAAREKAAREEAARAEAAAKVDAAAREAAARKVTATQEAAFLVQGVVAAAMPAMAAAMAATLPSSMPLSSYAPPLLPPSQRDSADSGAVAGIADAAQADDASSSRVSDFSRSTVSVCVPYTPHSHCVCCARTPLTDGYGCGRMTRPRFSCAPPPSLLRAAQSQRLATFARSVGIQSFCALRHLGGAQVGAARTPAY
eukprot:3940781-Prymnesium_polylepis.1